MEKLESKKRTYLGILLVALGVVMMTNLPSIEAVGVVFIAVGGWLVLIHLLGLDKRK